MNISKNAQKSYKKAKAETPVHLVNQYGEVFIKYKCPKGHIDYDEDICLSAHCSQCSDDTVEYSWTEVEILEDYRKMQTI